MLTFCLFMIHLLFFSPLLFVSFLVFSSTSFVTCHDSVPYYMTCKTHWLFTSLLGESDKLQFVMQKYSNNHQGCIPWHESVIKLSLIKTTFPPEWWKCGLDSCNLPEPQNFFPGAVPRVPKTKKYPIKTFEPISNLFYYTVSNSTGNGRAEWEMVMVACCMGQHKQVNGSEWDMAIRCSFRVSDSDSDYLLGTRHGT